MQPASTIRNWRTWPGIALWGALLVLALLPTLRREAHTDESWALYLAGQVLDGALPYLDFVDVNPPAFTWKSIPAVLLGRTFGLSSWAVQVLLLGGLALASLTLTVRVLRTADPDRNWRMSPLVMGFCVLLLPRVDYSQREQLALILTLPYATLAAVRSIGLVTSRRAAFAAGGLAAVGFSFKPHFLISWLMLEFWVLHRMGRSGLARPEFRSLILGWLLYGSAILLFANEYVPLLNRLAPVYHSYLNHPLLEVLALAGIPLLLIGVLGVAARLVGQRDDPLLDVYLVMYAGFLVAALAQQKGTPYHFLAAWGYGLLALTQAVRYQPSVTRPGPALVKLVGAGVLVAVIGPKAGDAVHELLRPDDPRYRHNISYQELLPVVRDLAKGEAVAVFSTSASAAWPLLSDAGAKPALRYQCLWPLPAIYHDQLWGGGGLVRPNRVRTGFEALLTEEVLQDLLQKRPRLLLVLRPDSTLDLPGASQRFDYLAYFAADPRIRAVLEHYQEGKQAALYTVWIRKAP